MGFRSQQMIELSLYSMSRPPPTSVCGCLVAICFSAQPCRTTGGWKDLWSAFQPLLLQLYPLLFINKYYYHSAWHVCWNYAKHAAYRNIEQITLFCAFMRFCLDQNNTLGIFPYKILLLCFVKCNKNKRHQVYECNNIRHCFFLFYFLLISWLPSSMLWVLLQFSVRAEIVNALHTLCWSFLPTDGHKRALHSCWTRIMTAVIIKLIVDAVEQGQAGKEDRCQLQRAVLTVDIQRNTAQAGITVADQISTTVVSWPVFGQIFVSCAKLQAVHHFGIKTLIQDIAIFFHFP